MKKLILILTLLIFIACNSQQAPVNSSYENISNNSQLKDFDNIYQKFTGTWLANLNNKLVKLVISKVENVQMNVGTKSYFADALLVRYEVKENGVVLESTLNLTNANVSIISDSPESNNSVLFFFNGGLCGIGAGSIMIDYLNTTQIKWNFIPESSVITNKNCPNYPAGGIEIYLPYEPDNIIFTKQ